MIRAVLDTNVYVAALLSRDGTPARLVRALAEGLFEVVVCPALLAELHGVLARPKIARRIPDEDARAYLTWLERVAIMQADPRDVPAVSSNPDDDYILALAHENGAQVVVSGDEHLLGLTTARMRVLSPAVFTELVESLR